MSATYKQIQKQIEQLQRKADLLLNAEVKGVVERIKIAIEHYGLTAEQLGLSGGKAAVTVSAATRKPAKAARVANKAAASAHKFSDGHGNQWSGRGPRPRWLREALAGGASMDDFRGGATSAVMQAATPAPSLDDLVDAPDAAAPKKRARKMAKRAPSTKRYADDAGNSWSGRGPKPGWLKMHLDGGRNLDEFLQAT